MYDLNSFSILNLRTGLAFTLLVFAAGCFSQSAASFDTEKTITVFIPGYEENGAGSTGVFGDDVWDHTLDNLAAMSGLPTMQEDPGAPDQIAATRFYGDTPPFYYTEEDIEDWEFVLDEFDGGVPVYALIVAKYIRHVLERSGAVSVNVIGGSFGALISRYMLEKNIGNLTADGIVDRWLIYVGSLAGNFVASNDYLTELYDLIFGSMSIDVDHLNYDWVAENIWLDPWSSGSPYLAGIIKHQYVATNDSDTFGSLTILSGGLANDSVTLIRDGVYTNLEDCSKFAGEYLPTTSNFYSIHDEIGNNLGMCASSFWALTSPRRARIRIIEAYIPEIVERPLKFPGEVVFQATVRSPLAADLWDVSEPINSWMIRDNNLYYHSWESGVLKSIDETIFHGPVSMDEAGLIVELAICEVDWWPEKYIFENFFKEYDVLGYVKGTVPLEDGISTLDVSGCAITLEIEVNDLYSEDQSYADNEE